jgi:2-dehydropantoate 2-reductase
VLGAGAVGCYFGGLLARAGAPVTLIGRAQHVEAITRDGLFLESQQFQGRIPVAATTAVEAARDATIILLCVKTLDTGQAAKALAPHRLPGAIVVSLQNGVDNVERVRAASGIAAFAAVVYVAASMIGPGHVKHAGRGDLLLGDLLARTQPDEHRGRQLDDLAALLVRAGIPCRVSDNIEADLWTKMLINCAYNAISALARARYSRIVSNPWTREVLKQVIQEVVTVARAEGVRFPPDRDLVQIGLQLADTMSNATSSTAQDIARGKRTEIDSLNGYVVRRGAELGLATPVNQTLHALVKLLEEVA